MDGFPSDLSGLPSYLEPPNPPTPATPSSPAYVPNPSSRGTVSLVSSCVITLALCVWTALHMNVSPPRERLSKWRRFYNKLLWAAIAVVAPDVVVWRACDQAIAASKLCDEVNRVKRQGIAGSEQKSKWSWLKRFWFWNTIIVQGEWTMTMGFFVVMGGFEVENKDQRADPSLLKDRTLTPAGVLLLAQLEAQSVALSRTSNSEASESTSNTEVDPQPSTAIELLPDPKSLKQLIDDKSKSDSLGKAVVCFQALWFISQIIARVVAELPVTPLEINTAAHVACVLVVYVTWWHKPQDVQVPVVLEFDPDVIEQLNCERFSKVDLEALPAFSGGEPKSKVVGLSDEASNMPIREEVRAIGDGETALFFLFLAGTLYGMLHTFSWNSHYPTLVEQTMWRISIFIVAWGAGGVMVFLLFVVLLALCCDTSLDKVVWKRFSQIILLMSIPCYVAARLYLIVEAFISIRSLPEGAYDTPRWFNSIPHIS